MKTCKECGTEKEANTDNFAKVQASSDGLSGKCKVCINAKAKERWRQKQGQPPMSEEERIAMIKERQKALAVKKAASAAVGSAAAKIVKKRKARKMAAKGHPFILESDRLITEMVDVANVIKNGKALLHQKCRELLAVLEAEGHGQGHD